MSNCRVEKRVWKDRGKQSDYTCLYYELDVGAPPQRGAQLRHGRWFSGPLTFVIWNVDDRQFKCRVADEVPGADHDYDYSHDFLVQNALHEGWKICESWGFG
ncbi:MAG: hypothetical protein WC383_08405 [Gammaproteobacteria bacterium]